MSSQTEQKMKALLPGHNVKKTNKWTYGDAGDRYRVKPGQIWQVGPHKFLCMCIENAKPNTHVFNKRPDVIYSDPPWGPANASTFRTKANASNANIERRKVDYYGKFVPAFIQQCELSKGAIFYENGLTWEEKVLSMFKDKGFVQTNRWEVTYYRKYPSVLHRIVHSSKASSVGEFTADLTGMDDDDTPLESLKSYPKGTVVYDPCTGQGLSAVTAVKLDLVFQGVELNPRRLAVTLDKVSKLLGEKPVKVT